jgi:hypothetical protein
MYTDIGWRNRFHGSIKRLQIRALATYRLAESMPGIDSKESIPGLLKHKKFGLLLHRLAESIPRLLKRLQIWALATKAGGIDSLESIAGLLKRLQIRGEEVTSWHNTKAKIVGTHKRMGREKKNISSNLCSVFM